MCGCFVKYSHADECILMCNIIEHCVFTKANNYLINILKNIKKQIYI